MVRSFSAAAAATLVLAACCGKPLVPQQATTSGAIGVAQVTVSGKQQQLLFVPQPSLDGNGVPWVAILDAAYDGTSKPLLGTVELTGHADLSLPTAAAASPTAVVVVGAKSPYVDFIDPVAGTVQATVTLPDAVRKDEATSYSGAGGLATGVVLDPAGNRAWISVPTGFLPIDLSSHQFGALVAAAPAESFAYWPQKGFLLAPFYSCSACPASTPGGGLQVVDTGKGTVRFLGGADGGMPVGLAPGAADVDPATGVALVADDQAGTLYTVNLSTAAGDGPAGTIMAPVGQVAGATNYTGVAVDPSGHRALLEQAASTGVALVVLPQQAGSGAIDPGVVVTADMPSPGGESWTNSGNPPGLAVTIGLSSQQPVGFVSGNGGSVVARIDLDAFAQAQPKGGAVDAETFLPLVTFIPAHN